MIPKVLHHIKAAILIAAFFASCDTKYSSEEWVELNKNIDSLSVEVARDVNLTYTDSAILRAKIMAPLMKRYSQEEEPYMEMPDGVKANFFDPSGNIQSTLTANYAINFEEKDSIVIRDSVRVINKLDEEIRSDEMIWIKEKRKIYSDKNVRIRIRDEKILIGKGFESNETFTKYRIKNLTGTINLKDENNEQDE